MTGTRHARRARHGAESRRGDVATIRAAFAAAVAPHGFDAVTVNGVRLP